MTEVLKTPNLFLDYSAFGFEGAWLMIDKLKHPAP